MNNDNNWIEFHAKCMFVFVWLVILFMVGALGTAAFKLLQWISS